jgi:hypothetical protein
MAGFERRTQARWRLPASQLRSDDGRAASFSKMFRLLPKNETWIAGREEAKRESIGVAMNDAVQQSHPQDADI